MPIQELLSLAQYDVCVVSSAMMMMIKFRLASFVDTKLVSYYDCVLTIPVYCHSLDDLVSMRPVLQLSVRVHFSMIDDGIASRFKTATTGRETSVVTVSRFCSFVIVRLFKNILKRNISKCMRLMRCPRDLLSSRLFRGTVPSMPVLGSGSRSRFVKRNVVCFSFVSLDDYKNDDYNISTVMCDVGVIQLKTTTF